MAAGSPKRIVLKFGTGVLTHSIGHLEEGRIRQLCAYIRNWREDGYQVILVSSGAVGLGMGVLGLQQRPQDMPSLQACAAIGQSDLVDVWKREMGYSGMKIAQVLLTRDDLDNGSRHKGVQDTLEKLLSCNIVPVINENDTVCPEEIKFGDNDVLSALVAVLVGAEKLLILSTVEGLKTEQGNGELVEEVPVITPEIEALAGGTCSLTAVGGMVSKIQAAKVAVEAGCGVVIMDGREPENLEKLRCGQRAGTYFHPTQATVLA